MQDLKDGLSWLPWSHPLCSALCSDPPSPERDANLFEEHTLQDSTSCRTCKDGVFIACSLALLPVSRALLVKEEWDSSWSRIRSSFAPMLIGERVYMFEPRLAGSVMRRTALRDSDLDVLLVVSPHFPSVKEGRQYVSMFSSDFIRSVRRATEEASCRMEVLTRSTLSAKFEGNGVSFDLVPAFAVNGVFYTFKTDGKISLSDDVKAEQGVQYYVDHRTGFREFVSCLKVFGRLWNLRRGSRLEYIGSSGFETLAIQVTSSMSSDVWNSLDIFQRMDRAFGRLITCLHDGTILPPPNSKEDDKLAHVRTPSLVQALIRWIRTWNSGPAIMKYLCEFLRHCAVKELSLSSPFSSRLSLLPSREFHDTPSVSELVVLARMFNRNLALQENLMSHFRTERMLFVLSRQIWKPFSSPLIMPLCSVLYVTDSDEAMAQNNELKRTNQQPRWLNDEAPALETGARPSLQDRGGFFETPWCGHPAPIEPVQAVQPKKEKVSAMPAIDESSDTEVKCSK